MADDDRRTDEIAIRELIDHQVMGWAAGSPEGYASVFTSDADYITFLGSHYKGRAAIAASYAPLFKKLLKGSRLDFEITQLRFLTPDVALVHAEGAVVIGRRQRSRRNTRVTPPSPCAPTADGYLPPLRTPRIAGSPRRSCASWLRE
jgi:uncharacterized protein (TIGR02246 family)